MPTVIDRKSRPLLPGFLGLQIVISLLLLCPAGNCPAEELTAAERSYLNAKQAIRFISQTVYPPFEFIGSDGDHAGMCIELARWIATEFGFTTQFQDSTFANAQEAILSGRADVLTSLFYSEKRDQSFDFTETIFEVPASIFVAAERPDIHELEDLQGKTIAMQAGDYAKEFLEARRIRFQLKATKNFAEAADLVIAGKADALIGDEQIVLYHLYSHDLTRFLKKVGEPLYIGNNCMAAKDANPVLIGILDKGIRRAREQGVLEGIQRKWLGVRLPQEQHPLLTYWPHLLAGAAALLVLAFLTWLWNVKLRQQVAAKTAQLAESETTLRAILEASPMGIALLREGRIQWHNEAMRRMLGYEPKELTGQLLDRITRGPLADASEETVSAPPAEQDPTASIATHWLRKDGSLFPCLPRYSTLPRNIGESLAVVVAEDITELKQAADVLEQTRRNLQTFFDTIDDFLFVLDEEARIQRVNATVPRRLGYSAEELLGQSVLFVHPPERREEAARIVREILNGERTVCPIPLITRDGRQIEVETRITRGSWDGRPAIFGVSKDITEIKRSEEKFSRAFHASPAIMAISSIDEGRFVDVNEAFLKHLGFSREEVIGRTSLELGLFVNRQDREEILRRLQRDQRAMDIEVRIQAKDGSIRHGLFSADRIFVHGQPHLLTVMLDISERCRAEEQRLELERQVQQRQKRESLGTMAGGIAHHFNNQLMVILGNLELIRMQPTVVAAAGMQLDHMEQAAQRAADLSRLMLTYLGQGAKQRRMLDLAHQIAELMPMIQAGAPPNVRLEMVPATESVQILIDPGDLHQVVLNLATNAWEAIGAKSGTVRLAVYPVQDPEPFRGINATGVELSAVPYACIDVSDDGEGMSPETLERIFDPFFSTRFTGRGLGLAITLGIVRSYEGAIFVDSEPQRGTSVKVLFPAAAEAPEATPAAEPEEAPGRSAGTVLLVDDEEGVRTVGRKMLQCLGLTVLEAAGGKEAIDRFRSQATAIDCVFLDLSMPGMDGWETLRELRQVRADVPVWMVTGYDPIHEQQRFPDLRPDGWMQKPYRLEALRRAVRPF